MRKRGRGDAKSSGTIGFGKPYVVNEFGPPTQFVLDPGRRRITITPPIPQLLIFPPFFPSAIGGGSSAEDPIMNAPVRSGFLAILVFAISVSNSTAQDTSKNYLQGVKSCVLVRNPGRGTGSGSVINLRDGYILTNWHVGNKGEKVLLIFPLWDKDQPIPEAKEYDRQERRIGLSGVVVAANSKVDLAVIKLAEPWKIPKDTLPVKFAAESPLRGTKIFSIGNPAASEARWVYTPGDVRSVYKKQWVGGDRSGKKLSEHDSRVIEATSAVSPGDSGGPCFNDKVEQIGVAQSVLNANVAQGYSYFVDCSEVKGFLEANKIPFNVENDAIDPTVRKEEPKTDTATNTDPKTDVKMGPGTKDTPQIDAADVSARHEKAASAMLSLTKSLATDPNKKKSAANRLRDLIRLYPDTAAAKEAKAMLPGLE